MSSPNTLGDGDVGPDNLQNFPVITATATDSGGNISEFSDPKSVS